MFAPEKADAKTSSANSNAMKLVDVMPEFPGGMDALMEYLEKNTKYPSRGREQNVKGRVYVNFIVSSKGKILFPYVVRGLGKPFDQEAMRVIRKMPAWKPGRQKGKAVPVRYNLPVTFN
jgi:periplasmic protein TonB